MSAQLKSSTHGLTMVLTVSNPGQRNALGPAIYAAGIEALNVAETNPDVRSVILIGEGTTFCAGGDLNRLQANRQQPPAVQTQSIDQLHGWIEAIRAFPKPVIAAVEGYAAGAGFALALSCDLIVAASDAVFLTSYGQVGLSPDGGTSWQLARSLPRQFASELLLAGERIGASRLHALGLVNRVCEPGHALDTALALAVQVNAQAPNVLASGKELLETAVHNSLHAHLAEEQEHFVRNLNHPNAGIGIAAFLNRQAPEFE
ncbi:enoyl-CoA hydratase [Hylemonella gracilis str. Niagara R]|uniref:Enoyl-CoA hydratase n=1 Tax=Hylemonella gracilis str. Niagara R TaxID=1458275 RepID=A0A016XFV5_9BURK|nr:enoyl-CoA hydratase [Hylemonella gracilis]EYC50974.1 enoyl-CoA hydratase [Hylemonella gracilis str. Niagara R]